MSEQTQNKLQAITEIYEICYANSSFSVVGPELAYTTQAILADLICELNPLGTFVAILKEKLPSNHIAWNHIHLEPTVICINCESEILWNQAAFCPPLEGWLGHNCCIDASEIECYYEEVALT